ncbi:DUF1093 domain-containing protein [Lacticaseibacillus daqingensis]|uniref:DUF1093 domain-containing protein n=1 Tax=Lacticaseibacillus daqingensis TaxID=2486014 RepID=UPI000F7AF6EE|nr:DUF1093 domain-containing protein [Lacticaseibacillus daqingensis]
MKKILGILLLVLVLAGGWFGFKYYNDTYTGTVGYAKVTTTPEKKETVDNQGVVQKGYYSYNYSFDFVMADGTTQTQTFEVTGKDPQPLTVGKYIKAKISKKRVLEGPNYVEASAIPAKALAKIQ